MRAWLVVALVVVALGGLAVEGMGVRKVAARHRAHHHQHHGRALEETTPKDATPSKKEDKEDEEPMFDEDKERPESVKPPERPIKLMPTLKAVGAGAALGAGIGQVLGDDPTSTAVAGALAGFLSNIPNPPKYSGKVRKRSVALGSVAGLGLHMVDQLRDGNTTLAAHLAAGAFGGAVGSYLNGAPRAERAEANPEVKKDVGDFVGERKELSAKDLQEKLDVSPERARVIIDKVQQGSGAGNTITASQLFRYLAPEGQKVSITKLARLLYGKKIPSVHLSTFRKKFFNTDDVQVAHVKAAFSLTTEEGEELLDAVRGADHSELLSPSELFLFMAKGDDVLDVAEMADSICLKPCSLSRMVVALRKAHKFVGSHAEAKADEGMRVLKGGHPLARKNAQRDEDEDENVERAHARKPRARIAGVAKEDFMNRALQSGSVTDVAGSFKRFVVGQFVAMAKSSVHPDTKEHRLDFVWAGVSGGESEASEENVVAFLERVVRFENHHTSASLGDGALVPKSAVPRIPAGMLDKGSGSGLTKGGFKELFQSDASASVLGAWLAEFFHHRFHAFLKRHDLLSRTDHAFVDKDKLFAQLDASGDEHVSVHEVRDLVLRVLADADDKSFLKPRGEFVEQFGTTPTVVQVATALEPLVVEAVVPLLHERSVANADTHEVDKARLVALVDPDGSGKISPRALLVLLMSALSRADKAGSFADVPETSEHSLPSIPDTDKAAATTLFHAWVTTFAKAGFKASGLSDAHGVVDANALFDAVTKTDGDAAPTDANVVEFVEAVSVKAFEATPVHSSEGRREVPRPKHEGVRPVANHILTLSQLSAALGDDGITKESVAGTLGVADAAQVSDAVLPLEPAGLLEKLGGSGEELDVNKLTLTEVLTNPDHARDALPGAKEKLLSLLR